MNFKHLLIFTSFILFATIIAQSDKIKSKPTINFIKVEKPIEINGKLDNSVWLLADPIEVNYEISPGDNLQAKEKTLVKALYDDEDGPPAK